MQIFVISLKSSGDRRASIEHQFRSITPRFRFFDAYGPNCGREDFFSGYDRTRFLLNTGRTATPGEIGCFASHRAVWKTCIELDEPVLIMEDDVYLCDGFCRSYETTSALIRKFGFIRLQYERNLKKIIKVCQAGEFSLHRLVKVPHNAMCYAISPAAARRLVAASETMSAPVDVFIKQYWKHKQPLYVLLPFTVKESPVGDVSTIGIRARQQKAGLQTLRLVYRGKGILQRTVENWRLNLSQPH